MLIQKKPPKNEQLIAMNLPVFGEVVTTAASLWAGVVATLFMLLIAAHQTLHSDFVDLGELYLFVPMYLVLRLRSRMFFPVAVVGLSLFLGEQVHRYLIAPSATERLSTVLEVAVHLGVAAITLNLIRAYHLVQADALTDALTGVRNRRGMIESWPKLQLFAEQRRMLVAAFAVDLNQFKRLNDTMGHETGDRALKVVANALREAPRKHSFVVRLGGDEFALFLPIQHTELSDDVRYNIQERVNRRLREAGLPMMSVSIGSAIAAPAVASVDHLLRDADARLYRAKPRSHAIVDLARQSAQTTLVS